MYFYCVFFSWLCTQLRCRQGRAGQAGLVECLSAAACSAVRGLHAASKCRIHLTRLYLLQVPGPAGRSTGCRRQHQPPAPSSHRKLVCAAAASQLRSCAHTFKKSLSRIALPARALPQLAANHTAPRPVCALTAHRGKPLTPPGTRAFLHVV